MIALLVSVAIPLLVGAVGALYTAPAIPEWYAQLERPSWGPPSWLFSPVWTLLYIAMGTAAWLVWRQGRGDASPEVRATVRGALLVYAAQLAVNGIWTPIFFGLKRVDLALVVILLLVVLIIETIRRFAAVDRRAAILLSPYLAWVSFASVLNAAIWQLNR